MLEELHVRDLALIDEAWLELGPGLTVLTGETGAGKTVLLGALKLLVGERADSSLVRTGETEGLVEGRFLHGGEEMLVRRRISAEGRSRCAIDGEMATVGELAERVGPLIDLHGQHEHQLLLHPSRHAAYLDRFAGEQAAGAVEAYREAFESLRAAEAEALADRERRADYLRFQVSDIDAVAPVEGEDEELSRRLPVLRHAEKLARASAAANRLLKEDDGAADRTAEALSSLASVSGIDSALDALGERLSQALAEIDDIGAALRDYGDSVEYDPRQLDDAEGRLAALQALKKKYGPTLADVLAARESALRELETLDSGEEALLRADAALGEARRVLEERAERLVAVRTAAVPAFVEGLSKVLAELAMPTARFDVAFEALAPERWSPDGPHRVEFLFSSVAGEAPKPLARVASGGEVSRVMLALKTVLGEADAVPVLVFDEVDAGIGGATGLAVGKLLRALARHHQVLVVTHLAQVAAFADRHLVVTKEETTAGAVTRVAEVVGEARVREIARMLSGSGSEAGIAHAEELLSDCAA